MGGGSEEAGGHLEMADDGQAGHSDGRFHLVYAPVNTHHAVHFRQMQFIVYLTYLHKAIKNINGLYILEILAEILFSLSNINYT